MTADSGLERPSTSNDVYDLNGRHRKTAAVDLTDTDEPSKARKAAKPSESGAERVHGRDRSADVERGAREKMNHEVREEMVRRSRELSHQKTLSMEGDRYKVADNDCLSTIAERRLRMDGEKINGKSIDAEVNRIRKLNVDEHPSLERKKDLIKTGWHLKIYDENTRPKSAPEASLAPTPAVVPREAARPVPPVAPSLEARKPVEIPVEAPRPARAESRLSAAVPVPVEAPKVAPLLPPVVEKHDVPRTASDAPLQLVPPLPPSRSEGPVAPYPHLRRQQRTAEPVDGADAPHPRSLKVVEPPTPAPEARPGRAAAAVEPYHRGEVLPPPPEDESRPHRRPERVVAAPPAEIPPRTLSTVTPDVAEPQQTYPRYGRGAAPAPYVAAEPAQPYYGAPSREPLREASPPEKFIGDVLSIPGKILQGIGDGLADVFRSPSDRNVFWQQQFSSYTCSSESMAMFAADWQTGHKPNAHDTNKWVGISDPSPSVGYEKGLKGLASDMRAGVPGVHTKVYEYPLGGVGPQAMQDLNKELAQGHTVVARVQNAHTFHNHYVYIAGRDREGNYILGDPDRHTNNEWHHGKYLTHQLPVKPADLAQMLRPRDGFVAGWKDAQTRATEVPGTAAYRFAQRQTQLEVAARQRANSPEQANSH